MPGTTGTPKPRSALAVAAALLIGAGCEVTAPDRTNRYGFQLQPENLVFSWPADRLPVKYFAQAIGPLPDYVEDALIAWQAQFLYGEFEAELTDDSAGADVRVVLVGGVPPAASLTDAPPVTACDGSTSATFGSSDQLADPIQIRVQWFAGFTPPDIANCLARVTAHEIGHSLGLFQHSTLASDLMFAVPAVRAPSSRDRATVEILYHTPATLKPAARP